MKKISKIWILAIVPLLIILTWFISEKIIIKKLVNEKCGQFYIGDDWVGCVIDLSLEKNDAKYCTSNSLLSPYPGLCMDLFSQRTQNEESCKTISKPRYKNTCNLKFK